MLVGDKQDFAIEIEIVEIVDSWVLGSFLFWISDVAIGDKDDKSVDLGGGISWLKDFITVPRDRYDPSLYELSKSQVYKQLCDSVLVDDINNSEVVENAFSRFHISHIGMSSFDHVTIVLLENQTGNFRCIWQQNIQKIQEAFLKIDSVNDVVSKTIMNFEAVVLSAKMKQVGIMTTEVRTISTMDISVENEVYNISRKALAENLTIAGVGWLKETTNHVNGKVSVLKTIFSLVTNRLPELKFWCIVGDSCWQNDNKIIRHRKLFQRLKCRGVEIENFENISEKLLEKDGKLKFFGAVGMPFSAIDSVINLIFEEPCSYIIAVPESFEIDTLISKGWASDNLIDINLISSIAEKNSLVFKAVGFFDDPESGFVGFGTPKFIVNLMRPLQ